MQDKVKVVFFYFKIKTYLYFQSVLGSHMTNLNLDLVSISVKDDAPNLPRLADGCKPQGIFFKFNLIYFIYLNRLKEKQ